MLNRVLERKITVDALREELRRSAFEELIFGANIFRRAKIIAKKQRIPLVEPPKFADMYMCASFTLRLPHVGLAQLRICFGLVVKDVVLKSGGQSKPCGSQRVRHLTGLVQVGNCDLYIDDILSA